MVVLLSCLRNDEVITLTDSEDDTDSVVVIGSDTSEEPTESTQFADFLLSIIIYLNKNCCVVSPKLAADCDDIQNSPIQRSATEFMPQ